MQAVPAPRGVRLTPRRSRAPMVVALALGTLAVAALALVVAYPRIGAWKIRRELARMGGKLGRDVRVGRIDVAFGHVVLRDLDVRGPLDGETPLVHVDRIDVDFAPWPSLTGTVRLGAAKIDGVVATVRRGADGRDNVRDVLDRLRALRAKASGGGGGGGIRPTSIVATHVRVLADDQQTGTTLLVNDGDATWTPAGIVVHARGLTTTTIAAPKAVIDAIEIDKPQGKPPVVKVQGGELSLWPRMALSGIAGTVAADPGRAGHYTIDLAGGYGGVGGQLWTAKGDLDPAALTASVDLEAAKFQLDRLAPILAHSAVVDYETTSVDTKLHLDVTRAGASFAGDFHLRGLNVGHPLIADKEVHDLDLSADVAGSFDRATRTLQLTRGDFVTRGLPFSITGTVVQGPIHPVQNPADPDDVAKCTPPHELREAQLHLVIPPLPCQRVLNAIPTDLAPYLAGYKLRGTFDAAVDVAVNWDDLDATKLDGHVGIEHCKVIDEPPDSPKRLKDEFEQHVEVEEGKWLSFQVGPSNPDFVPLDQISPYLVKSIMSTEDSDFYHHHGFIPTEFKSALITNLKACRFAYGASSITMQMVKNVLLSPEKTLARKLQELFLTWHVEHTLTKDRILEIYLNVIEYGPGIYGIGPAARAYFNKSAHDLNPVEAAFFSSILPNPKARYRQFCEGTLTKWTTGKIERILAVMLKRDRLTQDEYDEAIATPLVFAKDDTETVDQCLKRVKDAIKHARPTNPLAPKPPEPPHHHHHHR